MARYLLLAARQIQVQDVAFAQGFAGSSMAFDHFDVERAVSRFSRSTLVLVFFFFFGGGGVGPLIQTD